MRKKQSDKPRLLHFGEVLEHLMRVRKVPARDLAMAAGLSLVTIEAMIMGLEPPPDRKRAEIFAKVLGVDPRLLVVTLKD